MDLCASFEAMSTNGGAPVLIRHYTDPSCPFAFSAERQRLRLLWLYGAQIEWELHMVVLTEERPGDDFPPERVSASRRELQLQLRDADRLAAGRGRRVAARVPRGRRHAAARPRPRGRAAAAPAGAQLLRRSRSTTPRSSSAPCTEALIEPEEIRAWITDPGVEPALRADMEASRSPSPASRAQDYKLGGPDYGAPLHLPLLRADPRGRAARRTGRPASRVDLPGLPARRGLRGGARQHRPRAGAAARPGVRRGGAHVGPHADRHRRMAAVRDREIADVRPSSPASGRSFRSAATATGPPPPEPATGGTPQGRC